MTRVAKPTEWQEHLAFLMLVVAVFGSALAIGGVHVVTVLTLFCGLAAGTMGLLWSARPSHKTLSTIAPAMAIASLAAYSAIQAVPLPLGLLLRIAPTTADVWVHSLDPLRAAPPRYASLSLDPGASLVEAAKWSIYAVVFGVSAWIAERRGAARPIQIVFISSVVVALVTVGHGLLGAQTVYGIYVPHGIRTPWHTGPLLNPNNLSGYLNLGIVLGFGLLLGRRSILPRPWVALAIGLLEAENIIAASRAGAVAMVIGILALAGIVVRKVRLRSLRRARGRVLATGGALAFGAVLAVLGAGPESWAELMDQSTLKISMLLWSRFMIRDYWLFGIGRGAFESVFAAYGTYPGHQVFSHAENFPSQWAAEWGLPVGVAAIGGLAWLMVAGASRIRQSTMAAALWCGVLALLLQNLFDLALEIPAVCIALATCLGALWGAYSRARGFPKDSDIRVLPQRVRRKRRGWPRPGPRAVVAGCLAFALAVAISRVGFLDLEQDRSIVETAVLDYLKHPSHAERLDVNASLLAAMRRHPAEPYFPLMAAMTAWATHDDAAIFGIERSLERGRVNGRAHLLLAEIVMAHQGKAQARLELRHSVEDDSSLVVFAALLAALSSSNDSELLEAVPPGDTGAEMLIAATDHVSLGRQLTLLEEASRRAPNMLEVRQKLVESTLGALAARNPEPCGGAARAHCEELAATQIAEIERLEPINLSEPTVLRARLLVLQGKVDDGVSLLTTKCPNMADQFACSSALARILLAIDRPHDFDKLLRTMAAVPCASGNCPGSATGLGDLFAARGDQGSALTQYLKATELAPTAERWGKVAEAASGLGLHAQAMQALVNAARLAGTGDDPAVASRIEQERKLATSGVLP